MHNQQTLKQNKIWTPMFLDGNNKVAGHFLVIAETKEEADKKAEAVLKIETMAPYLYPYKHYTPFNECIVNIPVDGIICLN